MKKKMGVADCGANAGSGGSVADADGEVGVSVAMYWCLCCYRWSERSCPRFGLGTLGYPCSWICDGGTWQGSVFWLFGS